jgi:MFS superfamily sulfate permease-like transporter
MIKIRSSVLCTISKTYFHNSVAQNNIEEERKPSPSVERKNTNSYQFMKSQVVDNATKAKSKKKTKNRAKIIIGDKRKIRNANIDVNNSLQNLEKNIKESTSLILLKNHNQKSRMLINKDIHENSSFNKIYYKRKESTDKPRVSSGQRIKSVANLQPVRNNARSVPPSNIRLPQKRYK